MVGFNQGEKECATFWHDTSYSVCVHFTVSWYRVRNYRIIGGPSSDSIDEAPLGSITARNVCSIMQLSNLYLGLSNNLF